MVVRLSAFPEELDRGYHGRLMRFNGFIDEDDFIRYAAKVCKPREPLSCDAIPLVTLSNLAGKTTEEFARFHTLLPFRRAVTNHRPEVTFGSLLSASMLRTATTRARQKHIFFCTRCALEDIQFHGISYWRRDHQISGQVWCPKHRVALSFITNRSDVLKAPQSFQTEAPQLDSILVDKAMKNAAVNRFQEIAGSFLYRKRPLIGAAVTTELRIVARKRGLFTYGRRDTRGLMSGFIRSSYPANWLAMVVPDLIEKPEEETYDAIDGVFSFKTRKWPSISYLLIAAALYESSDDAIEKLTTCEQRWSPRSWGEANMAKNVASTIQKKRLQVTDTNYQNH